MKIVINDDFGGYALSKKALEFLGIDVSHFSFKAENISLLKNAHAFEYERHNPLLVKCVEELGHEANGWCAKLKIVEGMPGYKIFSYDGMETIYYEYDHCSHCDSPNVQGSKFCSQCGAPLGKT
jgi:hypothetical protein